LSENSDLKFSFYRLRFHFEACDAIRFPSGAPANILRGAFGTMLRRIACLPSCADARICNRRATCPYARTFEPAAVDQGPSGLADWPRPFVFRAAHLDGAKISPGRSFHFDVILFDLRHPPLQHVIQAFGAIAREGFGPGRGRASLERAEQVDARGFAADLPAAGPPAPSWVDLNPREGDVRRLSVEFVTPTELKSGGALAQPEFDVLISRARDRISTLRALYGPGPLKLNFSDFGQRAGAIRITRCDLQRVEAERRSSRTGQRHPLGGFTGRVEYEGDLAEFVPFLEAAQFTGVGRQTSWGKGEIRIGFSGEFPAGCNGTRP
jgi:hypothetical protein